MVGVVIGSVVTVSPPGEIYYSHFENFTGYKNKEGTAEG